MGKRGVQGLQRCLINCRVPQGSALSQSPLLSNMELSEETLHLSRESGAPNNGEEESPAVRCSCQLLRPARIGGRHTHTHISTHNHSHTQIQTNQ